MRSDPLNFIFLFDLHGYCRLLTSLFKRAWFCCLMICVISWSGVSGVMAQGMLMMPMPASALGISTHAATAQAQHCVQHAGNLSSEYSPVQHNSKDSLQHNSKDQPQHNADRHSHAWHCDLTDSTERVDTIAVHEHASSHQAMGGCTDCQMSLCQLPLFCLNLNDLALHRAVVVLALDQPQFDYRVQHLNGFWQQILRPPKA